MGIQLRWETESGKQLEALYDPKNYLGLALQLMPLDKTTCLRFIDPYGDTVFNQKQIPILINELQILLEHISTDSIAVLLEEWKTRSEKLNINPEVIEARKKNITVDNIVSHVHQILDLAHKSAGRIHSYLKFYGD